MHILARFFGFLLVLTLAAAALSWALASTLLNSDNLQNVLKRAQVAQLTASTVPALLSEHAEDPKTTKETLTKLITPQLISDQINSLVPQFVQHLKSGSQIFVDLRDLGQMVIASGASEPKDKATSPLFNPQPIKLGSLDKPLETAANVILTLQWLAPLLALVLTVLVLVTGGHGRFKMLAKPFLGAAILTAVLAGGVWLPVLITSMIAGSSQAKELEPVLRAVTSAVASAQSLWLLVAAGIYAAVAILLYVMNPFLSMAAKSRHKKEAKA